MNLVSWTPFRDMEGFFDRYQRMLGDRTLADDVFKNKEFDWRPSADISESKDHYLIKAELPEVEKDDVHVSIEDGMLTISGERRFEKEDESDTQHRIESMYGKFSRTFTLPNNVDDEHIKAETKNGVLKVRLPKIEEKVANPIEISVD